MVYKLTFTLILDMPSVSLRMPCFLVQNDLQKCEMLSVSVMCSLGPSLNQLHNENCYHMTRIMAEI